MAIVELLKKISGRLEIRNADERRTIATRQSVLQTEEQKALWDQIKDQTTYRVNFDKKQLIADC